MDQPTESRLPILDISHPTSTTARELVDAVSKYGFVYIKNNVMPNKSIASMFDLSRQFFKSPYDEKVNYAVNSKGSGKNSGWFGMNTEKLDPETQKRGDFKEAFNFNEFPLSPTAEYQPLPPIFSANKPAIGEFSQLCHAVCMRILELFAKGLEIEEASGGKKWFKERHDREKGGSGSVFRFLYYPVLPSSQAALNDEDGDIRCGAHSDYGSITLLFRQDGPGQAGLEILTDDGTWASVPIRPTSAASSSEDPGSTSSHDHDEDGPPILVNVGDLLSFWTNGLLRSTVHRVIFPTNSSPDGSADRYSIAYFCHPLDQAKLEAMPSRLVGERKVSNGERTVMTAKQHLESRLMATYT